MCGIAGIFGNNVTGTTVSRIIEVIGHRGPDGKAVWESDQVSLAHARLSIIDLSEEGNQPMLDTETGNRIVYNGEIYNYIELREKLKPFYPFKTKTDTEVILAGYKVYGIDFLKELRGMFAFALYDHQQQKTLLARDRFGIKPLYYNKVGKAIFIASEIKGLLCVNGTERKINELKAYEFLANRQLDCNHETMFAGIFQMLPAQYAWVSLDGEMEVAQSYWEIPAPGTKKFDEKAKEELAAVFNETVKIHLRSDVPVASFLSGGLDSTSIACFAARNMHGKKLPVFSAILPYYHPENSLIGKVLDERSQFEPKQFILDGKDFFHEITNLIYHHDEPVMDGSMYAHYMLCKLAKKENIKVLLSGSGGDELFGGYSSHVHAHHAKLIKQFKVSAYINQIKNTRSNTSWPAKELIFKSFYECLPVSIRRNIKNIQLRKNNPHLKIHPVVKHYYYEDADLYYANLLNNYKSWTGPPYLHYEDRNAMAFGVEVRVPFYDHVLVEYVLQYNDSEIIHGSTKSMIRNSFRGTVPDDVLSQKGKYGFPSPIEGMLHKDDAGRELFYMYYKQTPLLNEKACKKVADDFYSGKGNLNVYWRILSFIIWYRCFFTNEISKT